MPNLPGDSAVNVGVDNATTLEPHEAMYLLRYARKQRAKWADIGDDHASHKRILERERCLRQMQLLDPIIEKLEALAGPDAQPWLTPAVLRERPDADRIECQEVVSGRWKPLSAKYWDACVIPVKFRMKEATDA